MNKSIIVALLCVVSWQSVGQILDDSTKLVYGPTTSRFLYEKDMKESDTLFHNIDTTLHDIADLEIIKWAKIYYQNLGNNGTALVPIYFLAPSQVGRQTGQQAYSPYETTARKIKYYNTKSPFINLYLGLGGQNRNVINFSIARNINPQWNIGFEIKRIASNKLIGSSSLRDPQLSHSGVYFHVSYTSKKSKYHLLLHGYSMKHDVAESGGVKVKANPVRKDYFLYRDADINLRSANSSDERKRLRLYHDFSIKPFLEVYNTIEWKKYINRYQDNQPVLLSNLGYYPQMLIRTDTTYDSASLAEWSVETGVKGRVGKHLSYAGYAKRRTLNYTTLYSDPFEQEIESSIGGNVKINITKTNVLTGQLQIIDKGQYFLKAEYSNSFLHASYASTKSRPSYFVTSYSGNHYQWDNNFKDVFTNTIKGSLFYQFYVLKLAPAVEIATVNNYIYFGKQKTPEQNTAVVLLNKYTLNANLSLGKHFVLENRMIFNQVSGGGADAIRSPNWKYLGRWYYENIVFNDFMEMQIGIDIRWQSDYHANGYDPITQQFYLQNDLKIDNNWQSDFFFIMKAQRLTLWLKVNYLNQPRDGGYFATPLYPATPRTVDLGLRWHFYD